MAEFARAVVLAQRGDFEFEHQQGDDNREDAVAECFDSGEAHSPCAKRFKNARGQNSVHR